MIGRRTRAVAFALLACVVATARPARALDLEEALRQVAASNPTLAAQSAMVEAARRRVAPAGAWPAPMVEVGVENVPTTGAFDTDPMTMKVLGVSQRVPIFGANGLARDAARSDVDRAGWSAEMTRFEIYGMAVEAYADAWYAGQLARSADAHGGVMERLVQSARARYESGNGRLEELLRAQAEQARLLGDLAGFRAEERGARARLDALRGVPPGGAGDTLARLADLPLTPSAEPWLAAVIGSHPRLREMDAHVSHYRLAGRAARRRAWPDLELRASYGWRSTLVGSAHLPGPVEQDDMFSATVGFMLPIFAGSREGAEGAEMDAMARAGESERHGVELDLRRQVAATHAAAVAARRTVTLLADTVIAIQHRALEASWSAYRAGTTDLWRVFESAHALYAEEIALVRVRQDLARAQSQLIALTGRADLLGIALPETRSEP